MAFNRSKSSRRGSSLSRGPSRGPSSSPSRGPSRGPMASMDAARAAARAGNTGAPRATRAGGQAPSGRNPELQRASAGMDAARSRQQSRSATTPLPSGAIDMNRRMRGAIDMNRMDAAGIGAARSATTPLPSARGTGTPTQGGSMTNMQMPGFRPQAGGTPGGPSTRNPGGAPGGAPGMSPQAGRNFKLGGSIDGCAVKGKTRGRLV